MHVINLLIIPIIIIALFYKRIKFTYIVALTLSLAAAVFSKYYLSRGPTNILLTIAIFNLIPLACFSFTRNFHQQRLSLKDKERKTKDTHQQMLKERAIFKQSNAQLSMEAARIGELYKVTKDMSAALEFREIFEIFAKKMMELFRFKRCRLILVAEDGGPVAIKKVLELKYSQPQVNLVNAEAQDAELLKQAFYRQKIAQLEGSSVVLAPLAADNKFLGALVVEELPVDALDNFAILINQFSLEFKRVKLYQKVQELSITDGLTGRYVRRYFLERLREELQRSSRHQLQLSFLTIDIDHFKQCNDNYGHLTGDAVLKEVARKLLEGVREIDLVGRIGGEEFAILLPDTNKEGGGYVAERIRESIDAHTFRAYDQSVKIQVSIGVASFPQDSTSAQGLMDKSDQALYRAKQEGRNRVSVYNAK